MTGHEHWPMMIRFAGDLGDDPRCLCCGHRARPGKGVRQTRSYPPWMWPVEVVNRWRATHAPVHTFAPTTRHPGCAYADMSCTIDCGKRLWRHGELVDVTSLTPSGVMFCPADWKGAR